MMDIKTKIKQHIAKNILFSGEDFAPDDDASFLEQGIIDSLGFMELVAFVEKDTASGLRRRTWSRIILTRSTN